MRVLYLGPSDAVTVAGLVAPRGVPVDVPGDVGSALLAQGWVAVPVQRPEPSAPKRDWVAYAVARGGRLDEVEKATKRELLAQWGEEG